MKHHCEGSTFLSIEKGLLVAKALLLVEQAVLSFDALEVRQ
jgi:hypothetical protein